MSWSWKSPSGKGRRTLARRPKPKAPPPLPPRRIGRLVLTAVGLPAGICLVLGGVLVLGQLAQDRIRDRDRYTLPFADIDCAPPPSLSRRDFLDEVQYLAGLPARMRLLDADLAQHLATGFARHPWVARVEQVEVVPPARVKVRLRYRRPVLAVRVGDLTRAVDEEGVLLPTKAPTSGLPVYPGEVPPPAGPAGTRWGDAKVEAAARRCRTALSGGAVEP